MPALPEQTDYDVLVVGAGAVGASFACALADSKLRVGVIEAVARDQPQYSSHDDRGLALTLASQQALVQLGVWSALDAAANPIRHIHVSHRGCFGVVHLDAELLGCPALGYVVPARQLGSALQQRLDRAGNVDWLCPARLMAIDQCAGSVTVTLQQGDTHRTVVTRLLVAADGTQSRTRQLLNITSQEKDYGQVAVVSSVRPVQPHADTAWERFTGSGPLALLPLPDGRCVVVCCVATSAAEAVMALPDAAFLDLLGRRFGPRLGGFRDPGPRRSYPVRLVKACQQHGGRVVLLGNAAHTVHPNAAQGFNLGLGDATALARHVHGAWSGHGIPDVTGLIDAWLAERNPVQQRILRFTDTLACIFYEPYAMPGPLRSLGMLALELAPPLKRALVRRTAGRNPAVNFT